MANFFIEKMVITGSGKEPAVLTFVDGLNIVCGPSNTGKSYILECIDFVFGAEKKDVHFGDNTGYSNVAVTVKTSDGRIVFSRDADSNKVKVSSGIRSIESGDYNHKPNNNSVGISEVWLRLIGIADEHRIISSADFKKQRLTWRSFSHTFLLKEDAIDKKKSILLPEQATAKTPALTSLIFLLTGRDLTDIPEREAKNIRDAKKNAVIGYINEKLYEFSEFEKSLNNLPLIGDSNPQAVMDSLIEEITYTEKSISVAIGHSKEILQNILVVGEQLAECNTLYDRYQALKSQYASDIKRLGFIVDGEQSRPDLSPTHKCPFCESEISDNDDGQYLESSRAELQKLKLQLEDLSDAESDIVSERIKLTSELDELQNERRGVDALINGELKPRANALKEQLESYRVFVATENQALTIKDLSKQMSLDAENYQLENETSDKFDPRDRLGSTFTQGYGECIKSILTACKFEGGDFNSYFDIQEYDVVINGKRKAAEGQGYRAFINTVMAIAFRQYTNNVGVYKPGILIIDSPVETLSEPDDVTQRTSLFNQREDWSELTETMKESLFQFLIDNQENGQTIIAETEIPNLNYEGINLIRFTHTIGDGRYGLLNGIL